VINLNLKFMSKNICFAYYGDNTFLGWYSDTFGTLDKNVPKIYSNSEKQISIIRSNFNYKMDILKGKIEEHLFKNLIKSSNHILSKYDNIELRIVKCPIYDGPNPNFNKEDYIKWLDTKKEEEKYNIPTWIYANIEEVKEWAKNEPIRFIDVIKYNYNEFVQKEN